MAKKLKFKVAKLDGKLCDCYSKPEYTLTLELSFTDKKEFDKVYEQYKKVKDITREQDSRCNTIINAGCLTFSN